MPEQVRCPSCNAALRVPDNLLGKNVKCPKCQKTFTAEMDAPEELEEVGREPARRSREPEELDEEESLEEEQEEERPRRRRRRGRSLAAAQSAVAGPAIALMIVGGIALGLAVLGMVLNLLGVGILAAGAPKGGGVDAVRMAGGFVGGIVGICYGGIITSGAAKMKSLSSYGYAMTACIVAMLPCSLCCVLGLPFGIWGLVILLKPEVKDAFR